MGVFDTPTCQISIHALRVEGDTSSVINRSFFCKISIHALRVEGDQFPSIPLTN